MSLENDSKRFRKKRAGDLRIVADVLDSVFGSKRGVPNIDTGPLRTAATNLEGGLYNDVEMKWENWGYTIENFKMPVETIKHIRPKGIKKVELTLNMSLEADFNNWGTLNDPLISLNFNVVMKGLTDKISYFCFHIDKHDMAKFSTEPHPIYHIQYSPKPKNIVDEEFEYGNVLHLDTPRLMHQPLDLILGIGFLISNFAPSKWDKLIDNRFFKKAFKDYQICISKPYHHSFANHWDTFDSDKILWNNTNHICPFVI